MKIVSRISGINFIQKAREKFNFSKLTISLVDKTPACDCFERQIKPVKAVNIYDFLKKDNKFCISDYNHMNTSQKEAVRLSATYEQIEAADENIRAALALKKKLDQQYGDDKYIFASIGSSPSLIAKVLECTGVETRYLPMSGLCACKKETATEILLENNFEEYKNFLLRQGIDNTCKKKVLFYDYTISGSTLKFMKQLITKNFGMSPRKMKFKSLNKDLEQTYLGNSALDYKYKWLTDALASKYTAVGEYNYNLANTAAPEKFTIHDNEDTKFFNFLVMDKLNGLGLLKENPANRVAL